MGNETERSSLNDFERERFPCTSEWWCAEGFFTTVKGEKHWSFKADFLQAVLKRRFQASSYSLTIFDLDRRKKYYYYTDNDEAKLISQHHPFCVQFESSSLSKTDMGYVLKLSDETHDIRLNLDVLTASTPYWVAQHITNGWLPWGFGYYRYGFLPKNTIKGTLHINNNMFTIQGNSYLEHAWGDFSYLLLPSPRRSLTKIVAVYARLFGWWVHNHRFTIPTSLSLSTDNRPPGYDWCWAISENGWSLFFGNFMFWITEGPATGTLIVSKDGEHYEEFADIQFKYNQLKYIKEYDFYYPTDLELIARKGDETLSLYITGITESAENVFALERGGHHIGVLISQVPSKINGYLSRDGEKITLIGNAKLESHRVLTTYGHTLIKFDTRRMEEQRVLGFYLNSHYLGKELHINVHLPPRPRLIIKHRRIERTSVRSREKYYNHKDNET